MTTRVRRRRRPYPPGEPTDAWTVAQLRAWIEDHAVNGVHCLACSRANKYYARKIDHDMVKSLIQIYEAYGRSWGHTPSLLAGGSSNATSGWSCKLRFWGLLEEERVTRPDGGRAGYWRVTRRGELFLQGRLLVPQTALLYNNRLKGFTGDWVSVHDCLGTYFDLRELMEPAPVRRRVIRRAPSRAGKEAVS